MILGLSAAVNPTYANDGATSGGADYKTVISSYITSYINTDYKLLDKIMADDACVKIPRAETVLNHSRAKLIEQMKNNAGTQQNCDFKYSVLDKSDAMVIARVDFKYTEFIQHNYLVLEKDQNKNWKITQVCKFFEDIEPSGGTAVPAIAATN